jgi:hypothetical protein
VGRLVDLHVQARLALALAHEVDGAVASAGQEPAFDVAFAPIEFACVPPEVEKDLLHNVFRHASIAQDADGHRKGGCAVPGIDLFQRRDVLALDSLEEFLVALCTHLQYEGRRGNG